MSRHNYVFDLTEHEHVRLATIAAVTPDGDLADALDDERLATEMLMTGLDAEQCAIRERLIAAGVL